MKLANISFNILIVLLLVLWIPVAIDKIINFSNFQNGILRQPFSNNVAYLAIYFLPMLEIATIVLLIINRLRQYGLFLSSLLMTIFTFYVALALIGTWKKLPCGCGSVISGLSWSEHLWFNIFFLFISIIGLILSFKINDTTSCIKKYKSKNRININK